MEWMTAIFAFGSIWFFLFSGLWVVLLFYWVEKQHIILSGLNIILYILFLNFIVKKDVISSFIDHPGRSLIIILVYILAGFIWSFIKWWLFVNNLAINYKEKRCEWLKKQKSIREKRNISFEGLDSIDPETPVPERLREDWLHSVGILYEKPKVNGYKISISHWVLYWPVSAIWSLLDDFVSKVIQVIVVKIRVVYEKITNNAFKNIEEIDRE